MNFDTDNPESAVILAPTGRDARIIVNLLGEVDIAADVVSDLPALFARLSSTSFAVLAEEALLTADLSGLVTRIEAQPAWSDYPFILLTLRGGGPERNPAALRHMRALGNVTFLERPFQPLTLVSIARTALASRRRQYQARDRLLALEASRAAIERSDDRLKFALEAGRLGSWQLTLRDRRLETSGLCRTHFGIADGDDFTYPRLLEAVHRHDRERVLAAAQQAIDRRSDLEIDCQVATGSGERRWVQVRGRATYSADRADEMAGVTLDITQRKLTDERQNLLIRELHHRVKNTLSTVQAIVGSTARGAASIDGFYRDFTGRIMSLANTHTILTEELWQRASLFDLLRKELELYDNGDGRVSVSGPEVELPSDYAVPLGMAFHELTTNAAKYGALSNDTGRVTVAWALEDGADTPRVRLSWTETGGPAVEKPARQGFGTRLLDRVLTAQVKAEVALDFAPEGLTMALSFALPDRPAGTPPVGWS